MIQLVLHPVDARYDLIPGDLTKWTEDVFTAGPDAKWSGRREVTGIVEKGFIDGSEGPERLRVVITASDGHEALPVGRVITREVAKLQRLKLVREQTKDEDERTRVRARLGQAERDLKWAALAALHGRRSAAYPAPVPAISQNPDRRAKHKNRSRSERKRQA